MEYWSKRQIWNRISRHKNNSAADIKRSQSCIHKQAQEIKISNNNIKLFHNNLEKALESEDSSKSIYAK